MKFKKILTGILLCLLSFTGLFFGCGDKYQNFSIEVNGGTAKITLVMNGADNENEEEILIKIDNAPNSACKKISYSVSKANIIKVEELTSNDSNFARFKITALENITSYDPSCVITFKTAEGNKTCNLNVNVEIPINGMDINKEYSPYVITGGEDYYINTANLVMFSPANTTERDVKYSLIDETLKEEYGLTLTENGKVSIENYIGITNNTALKSFDVKVTSINERLPLEKVFTVNVYKEIIANDISVAFGYTQSEIENNFNSSPYSFIGEEGLTVLQNSGITFATNKEDKKNIDFGVFLNNGLDFNQIEAVFEKTVLKNCIVESDEEKATVNISRFKIYSLNPEVDYLTLKLKYKNISNYEYTIVIPVVVKEFPVDIVVNNSDKTTYNIFDYYKNNNLGQEFKVNVLNSGAFDRKFKIAVGLTEEQFNQMLEVRYKNEVLSYAALANLVLDAESSIYLKAKITGEDLNFKLAFYSNTIVASDLNTEAAINKLKEENANLVEVLDLNLTAGITNLNYNNIFLTKEIIYLEKGKEVNLDFVVNGKTEYSALSNQVMVEISKGAELVEIEQLTDANIFTIKSKGELGQVKLKLVSENGFELSEKIIQIYNYDDGTSLSLDLSSNNIKKVYDEGEDKTYYYLGLIAGVRNAAIKVNNPNNASICNAEIVSGDSSKIVASVTSLENLTFNIFAVGKTESEVTIDVKIYLFKPNNEVNNGNPYEEARILSLSLKTYYPIENVTKLAKQAEVVDGDGLDVDSLNKELNILDVENYLKIDKADSSYDGLIVDYIMPTALTATTFNGDGSISAIGDYEFVREEGNPFAKIKFYAGKNHTFVDGKYTFSFTIRIEDLAGSGQYHLVSLKVVLQKNIAPKDIEILNEDGYLYLTNTQGLGEIKAKVNSETGQEVTNPSLSYKLLEGSSISLDENSGLVSIKSGGISKVEIRAKASQYVENGHYSVTKIIYVVIADGTENYPYIYNGSFADGKFYTLNKDLSLNSQISSTIGGINGKFVYSKYTNNPNESAIYSLIYSKEEAIFGEELTAKLENLNIVINTKNIDISSNFGFIAQANTNSAHIKNVNLIVPELVLNIDGDKFVGLMFAQNDGTIENSSITGQVVLNGNDFTFGGMVAQNTGVIKSNYNFIEKSKITNFASTLNISANAENATIGGIVGENTNVVSNLSAQALINTNSLFVGGIIGVNDSNEEINNLLFKGNINSSNDNSIVGGIAGKVEKGEFGLIITEFVNTNKTTFGANLKGNTVGGLFGEAQNVTISHSYVNSLVSFDNGYYDISGTNVGGLIGDVTGEATLTAVYTNVKLNGVNVGALVNEANTITIADAYSFSTGANALVNNATNAIIINTYSTNCSYVYGNIGTDNESNYTSNNYINVVSKESFKTGNWRYSTTLNAGLPYLVYNDGTFSYNLLTIIPNSINANFVVNNKIEGSVNYYQGFDENIIVINEGDQNIKAVVYYQSKLTYNVSDILNITTIPANADKSNIKLTSSNSGVISVNDKTLNILSCGNVVLTISYLQLAPIEVYISVVEKVESVAGAVDLNLLKNHTKLYDVSVNGNGNNYGLYFNFEEDVENKLLYNNFDVENKEIYTNSSVHIFKGKETTESSVKIVPYYIVNFNGEEHKVLEYSKLSDVTFKIIEGATSIYSDVRYIEIIDKSSVEFEVIVKTSNNEEILNLEELTNNDFGDYFEVITTKSTNNDEANYTISLSASKGKEVKEDIPFEIKLYPDSNEDLSITLDILLKSSKLISAELNHYSSSTYYYDAYNYIITPEAMPNSNIVAGNLGVLNINLYPSYANINKIEVISSEVNGNKINFSQLAYKEESLVVISNAGSVDNGIMLKPKNSVLNTDGSFGFDGNLYVSTLLPTNVVENTIFTITVICYFNNLAETKPFTIDLTAKPLTSIVLTDSKGSGLYLAKGAELELDINLVNFDLEANSSINSDNFEIEAPDGVTIYKSINYSPEDSRLPFKLIVSTDILTQSGAEFKITPKFIQWINGKEVVSYSNSITIKIVDFVINAIYVEDAQDGILNNNLGNISLLRAKLDVSRSDGDFSGYNDGDNNSREIEYSNILSNIEYLEEIISKSGSTFNLVSTSGTGNQIYTNIVEGGNYSNFTVAKNIDGYLEVKGKMVSQTNMLLKANISYENGKVQLNNASNLEFRTPFVFNVKTYSSEDNPLPINSYQDFLNMKEGEDYILLKDITIPEGFTGISTNIASFDGNNKTININGFAINETSTTDLGLFNNVGENIVIKNVTVNIMPTIFYANETYYYGLNINAQSLNSLNFGVIAGKNAGVITNCKVINNNYRELNKQNQYKVVSININAGETVSINAGALVGLNAGYITNSKVGERTSSNSIKIMANASLGGFVGVNEGKIASSYAVNMEIINSSKTKLTGGFVAVNKENAQIITSYVEGYQDRQKTLNITDSLTDGGISAVNNVGGFVGINNGKIKDSYSNIKVETNKRSAGFVYDNSNGYIETCYSASSSGTTNLQAFRYFTGSNEENVVLNNKGIKYSYYKSNIDSLGNDDDIYAEPATGTLLASFSKKEKFEGFIADDSSSTIWAFGEGLPTLYDANQNIISERKLLDEANSLNAQKYNYIYINNNIGTINNPIIVSTSTGLLNALTNTSNLYSYYFAGRIIKTNINYNHIQIVKDINLSTIIDANNNVVSSASEVQKLQDIIFAGNLNGNGMEISGVTITAKNDSTNYSSFGLFKQIGVEYTYNNQGNIQNSYLDEDSCTTVKNINFDIVSISATITRSVGTLSGEIINSKLYNINIESDSNVMVIGNNIVGGVAGRISGRSFVKGVSSNLSVQATYDNKLADYAYKYSNSKKVYKYAYDVIEDELNNGVNFAGGLFGVVDIYDTIVTNYAQQSDGKSYYITANIVRENNKNYLEDANVQFVKVKGDNKIQGDVVGGLFGYVSTGSVIYDATYMLENSNSQAIIADYTAGAIAGINSGYISYAKVEHEKQLQRKIDKGETISSSNIFANENNNALIVGGIIGILQNGILQNSYSKADVNATNSKYVGSSVGSFANSKMNHVYAVANLTAQAELTNDNGIITQNKGYAGFIGYVTGFKNSYINSVVSLVLNKTVPTEFNLASIVGYNLVKTTTLTNVEVGLDISIPYNFGESIDAEIDNYALAKYTNKEAGTFINFNNNNWYRPTIYEEDTYPYLIYNKEGSVTSVEDEEALRNIMSGQRYTLTKDIYLTRAWDPLNVENVTLTSEPRKEIEHINTHGQYYRIYNLNINTKSLNTTANIGFFAEAENCTIENVTFVVGTRYLDPQDGSAPDVNDSDDENWPNKIELGIRINNEISNISNDLSLGSVIGKDKNSYLKNVTVLTGVTGDEVGEGITTNLHNIGGLIGYANQTKIEDCTVQGLTISKSIKEPKSSGENQNSVGGVIGYGSDVNIENKFNQTLKNIDIKSLNERSYKVNIYAGIFAGRIITTNEISSYNIEDSKINITGAQNDFIGGFAGEISSNEAVKKVTIKSTEIIASASNNVSTFNVGGLIGKTNAKEIKDINIENTTKINVEDNHQDVNKISCVGGVIGLAIANNNDACMEKIVCEAEFEVQVANSGNSFSYLGGIIGKNGENPTDLTGYKLDNILSTSFILYKESSVSKNIYAGGLIGQNYNNTIANCVYLGKMKMILSNLDNVGAIIGNNQALTEFTNVSYIEELSLVNERKEDFGTAISYNTFLTDLTDYLSKSEAIYSIIETLLNGELTINNIKKESEEITFEEGSLYNPITINSFESVDFSNEEKYFILTSDSDSDLTVSTTIGEFKGNLIGGGKTITLNVPFANKVSEKSLISSVVFEVNEENNTETINNVDYSTAFKVTYSVGDSELTAGVVVTSENNGNIFNVATTGNLYYYNDNNPNNSVSLPSYISPIAAINNGFISNVISNNNILIGYKSNGSTSNTLASGFVASNKGTIYNSISGGNIETFSAIVASNDTVKELIDYYNINAENWYLDDLAGFVAENNAFVKNCVSSTVLPVKTYTETNKVFNFANKNEANGSGTVYADYFTNGNYTTNDGEDSSTEYFDYGKLNEKISNFTSSWSTSKIDTLYSYSYPQLSIYKEEDTNNFLKTALKTTESGAYLVNNFSTLNNVIDALNIDETKTEINIKQVRSFVGSVSSYYTAEGEINPKLHQVSNYNTTEITKNLNYNGNGFAILGLYAQSVEKEGAIYGGLYYVNVKELEDDDPNNDDSVAINSVTIKNLAIVNANVNLNIAKYYDVYLGVILAKSNVETTISGCYVDGELIVSTSDEFKLSDISDDKQLFVGGLVGLVNSGTVSNNVGNISISINSLPYKTSDLGAYYGYIANVGGIIGKAVNATISNNYTFKDIMVSTTTSLNLGGIVGEVEGASTVTGNLTTSRLAYNGAYLSYYTDPASEDLLNYNINAIIGKSSENITTSDNKYNQNVSFVSDNFGTSTGLAELFNYTDYSIYSTGNDSSLDNKNLFTFGVSQMIEWPEVTIVCDESITGYDAISSTNITVKKLTASSSGIYEIELENNKTIIVDLPEGSQEGSQEGSLVTFDLSSIEEKESVLNPSTGNYEPQGTGKHILSNTNLIFQNKVKLNTNSILFDKIENSTISNIDIALTATLEDAVLAKEIENTKLYNISLNDAYIEHRGSTDPLNNNNNNTNLAYGMLVNKAVNSHLKGIAINKGRLQVTNLANNNTYAGSAVGYSENTLIEKSTNSATITVYGSNSASYVYVAGILGYGKVSSMFNCTNYGYIYGKTSYGVLYVAGIANTDSNSCVSFCLNGIDEANNLTAKIKGVNDSLSSNYSYIVSVSGVANNASIRYSINKGYLTSIAPNLNGKAIASGVGTNSSVFGSYNHGNVTSTGKIYALTSSNATYSYNMGNGSSQAGADFKLDNVSANDKDNYIFDILSLSEAGLATWNYVEKFAEFADIRISREKKEDDTYDPEDEQYTLDSNLNRHIPYIRLIDPNNFALTKIDDKYYIYSPFELWYWGHYCADDETPTVLANDINMANFVWTTPSSDIKLKSTFDGNHHTISNLEITPNNSNVAGFVSVVAASDAESGAASGVIQNVHFENPKLLIETTNVAGGEHYYSIVAGKNYGKISNVLVSSTDGTSFIALSLSHNDAGFSTMDIYTGVISGYITEGATVEQCQVINLGAPAINLDLSMEEHSFVGLTPMHVYTGGIVGGAYKTPDLGIPGTDIIKEDAGTIDKCVFIGQVISSVYNDTSSAVDLTNLIGGEVAEVIADILFAHYGTIDHYVGAISGYGKFSNCFYYEFNTNENDDPLLMATSLNKQSTLTHGDVNFYEDISETGRSFGDWITAVAGGYLVGGVITRGKSLIALGKGLVKAAKGLVKVAKRLAKMADTIDDIQDGYKLLQPMLNGVKGANSTNPVGWIINGIITALELETSLHNATSNHLKKNDYVSLESPPSSFKTYPYDNDYIKLFKPEYVEQIALKNLFDTKLEGANIPLLDSFLNLSTLKEKPVEENGTYYIYNVNQLAYALTEGTFNTIVYMDHLDMSKRIWDDDCTLREDLSDVTIVNNGFKLVLGSNVNAKTLEDENVFTDELKTKLNAWDETTNYTISNIGEYGFVEAISLNPLEQAYKNFEARFKATGGEIDTNGNYIINNEKQVEVIADALFSYSCNGEAHYGINFYEKTFIVTNDLDLNKVNVTSFDQYNYKIAVWDSASNSYIGKNINEVTNTDVVAMQVVDENGYTLVKNLNETQIGELDKQDEEGFYSYTEGTSKVKIRGASIMFVLPEFIRGGTAKNVYTEDDLFTFNSDEIETFCGTIKSEDSLDPKTITLKTNQSFMSVIGASSTISNLIIKARLSSNSICVVRNSSSEANFGFVACVNEGKLNNIKLKLNSNDITLNFNISSDNSRNIDIQKGFSNLYEEDKDKLEFEDTISLHIEANLGLFVGKNLNSIEKSSIEGCSSVTVNIECESKCSIPDIEITYNENNTQKTNTITPTTTNIVTVFNIGYVSGLNKGGLSGFDIKDLSFKVASLEVKASTEGRVLNNVETNPTCNLVSFESNAGLIAGKAVCDYKHKDILKIENISLLNSNLTIGANTDATLAGNTSGLDYVASGGLEYYGLICGYSENSFENCSVFNISAGNVQNAIAGLWTPKLYNKMGGSIYYAYYPTIKNIVSDSVMFGSIMQLALTQEEPVKNSEDVPIYQVWEKDITDEVWLLSPEYGVIQIDSTLKEIKDSNITCRVGNDSGSYTDEGKNAKIISYNYTTNDIDFEVEVSKEAFDSKENNISDLVETWPKINNNNFIQLTKSGVVYANLMNGDKIYLSNDSSLSSLGFTTNAIVNGVQDESTGVWNSNLNAIATKVTINGKEFMATASITDSTGAQTGFIIEGTNLYTLTIKYALKLNNIETDGSMTYGQLFEEYIENFTITNSAGTIIEREGLNAVATAGIYTLSWEEETTGADGEPTTVTKSFTIEVVGPPSSEPTE